MSALLLLFSSIYVVVCEIWSSFWCYCLLLIRVCFCLLSWIIVCIYYFPLWTLPIIYVAFKGCLFILLICLRGIVFVPSHRVLVLIQLPQDQIQLLQQPNVTLSFKWVSLSSHSNGEIVIVIYINFLSIGKCNGMPLSVFSSIPNHLMHIRSFSLSVNFFNYSVSLVHKI